MQGTQGTYLRSKAHSRKEEAVLDFSSIILETQTGFLDKLCQDSN